MGVWIETQTLELETEMHYVTPFVGVWIETTKNFTFSELHGSHPSWVCGLKLLIESEVFNVVRHTLRGCVD